MAALRSGGEGGAGSAGDVPAEDGGRERHRYHPWEGDGGHREAPGRAPYRGGGDLVSDWEGCGVGRS